MIPITRNRARAAATLFACALMIHFGLSPAQSQPLDETLDVVQPGQPAPTTAMRLVDGSELTMDDLLGKVVLVNFWATWCPPCIHELPTMQTAHGKYDRRDFEVIAIAVGETPEAVHEFREQLDSPLEFPIAIDRDLAAYAAWDVRGLPTSFLIDRSGMVRYKAVGGRNFASAAIDGIIGGLVSE